MQLHLVPGSPNCRKVQAVVAELGLDREIEFVFIDFDAGAHKAPDYLELNPNGVVPTLVDGDLRLWESNAIMQYLADRFRDRGGDALLPAEAGARADVVRWQFWESAHFGRHLGSTLFERLFKPLMGGLPEFEVAAAGLEAWRPLASLLGAHLEGRAYVGGDRPTLADYTLACQLPIAHLGGVDLSPYPTLVAWLARLDEQPAWQAAATPPAMLEALEQATRPYRKALAS
jgi:glutathione S-transferase